MGAILEQGRKLARRAGLAPQESLPMQPGEPAAMGDVFEGIVNLGNPVRFIDHETSPFSPRRLLLLDRPSIAGKKVIINRPAAYAAEQSQGSHTVPFTITEGAVVIWGKAKARHRLAIAAAYGEFEGDDHMGVIGGVHSPSWSFWDIKPPFRDPDRFESLVKEAAGQFMEPVDYLSFRFGFSDENTVTVTVGDSGSNSTSNEATLPAAELLDPETRPKAITIVTESILGAVKSKYLSQ